MKANIDTQTCVAVIGLPGSGTSAVAKFLNGLDYTYIAETPHRLKDISRITTKYGVMHIDPHESPFVLNQIQWYAGWWDLLIYGFQETWDMDAPVNPMHLTNVYAKHIDLVLSVFREPMQLYGTTYNKVKSPAKLNAMYLDMYHYAIEHENHIPLIISEFQKSPMDYMNKITGWNISGEIEDAQYVEDEEITSDELREARYVYMELLNAQNDQ